MKVRIVIPKVPYKTAKGKPESPLSCELRAWLTPGPIPDHYIEIIPDKQGGLRVKEPDLLAKE